MVVITVETYKNARVHTITVGNKKLFWVKIKDVPDGLGVKSISDILGKKIRGIFAMKDLTKEQKQKCLRSEYQITKNIKDDKKSKYARCDVMEKIIKNSR